MPTITARDSASLLAAALARMDDADLRAGAEAAADRPGTPRGIVGALNALRRRGPISSAFGRPQYRAVLPHLASAVSEDCLAETIEVLGDHADEPTREQLIEALEAVGKSHSEATIGVMLASVAVGGMAASDICLEVLTEDDRFGLADFGLTAAEEEADEGTATAANHPAGATDLPGASDVPGVDSAVRETSAEQRAARRDRRRASAEQRRQRQEMAHRADERVRSRRKEGRAAPSREGEPQPLTRSDGRRIVPTLVRRPALTPLQLKEFDPGDPLVGALVSIWVPFSGDEDGGGGDEVDRGQVGTASEVNPEGKKRPGVVVAVGAEHLLIRPCYSEGGKKGRDWTSVPVRDWQSAGLNQPTWIGAESVRVQRPQALQELGRLTVADWNALW